MLVLESAKGVPWTKPDELTFDPAAALLLMGAGSPHRGGFHAAFADAAVRFLKNTVNLNAFRSMITLRQWRGDQQ